jgi:cleavage and polyadenylation specificity factor subunit 1
VANTEGRLPPAKHKTLHHIKTTGPPATARFRRLDAAKLAATKADFAKLEKEGIIRRSSSTWSAPLHMVMKPDGTWRPCGDYRRLNLATTPDSYPLPNIQDLSARLHGCSIFSKLDLRKGYYQIPVQEGDIHKTAVITPFGLWEFLRMPFGLRNAGQSFQRFMDEVLAGLDFAFCYLDDILIASSTEDEHLQHLQQVLQRLQQYGLVLNMEKCELGRKQVDFLGHHITADGAAPITRHVEAVQNFPTPQDKKQLQSFLGLVNFYRRFIPAAARILLPLTDALRADQDWVWSPAMQHSFQLIKDTLTSVAVLAHPDPAAEVNLAVDASNTHIGAVLQQRDASGGWRPLAFFSKKLDAAQLKYSAFDRELLAAYLSVRHFRYLLDGRKFHILSDHKPLTQAMHRVSDPWTARVQRQLSYLAELTSDVRHIAGKANVVADALSRPPPSAVAGVKEPSGSPATARQGGKPESSTPSLPVPQPAPAVAAVSAPAGTATPAPLPSVDYSLMAVEQQRCEETRNTLSSSSLQVKYFPVEGNQLACDVSLHTPRPLVPASYRQAVIRSLHSIAHPGIRATKRLVSSRFVWRRMGADIAEFCKGCQQCARSKVTSAVHAQVQPIEMPAKRFSHVHVDLVGPLPAASGGFSHLFTIVDRSTRWAEAVPISGTSTEECAAAFFSGWVSRFGVPSLLTSDRGVQFASAIWSHLCSTLGISHRLTTAYHPQANGMVERFHRQLKDALRARLVNQDWLSQLPWVLLGLRAAPKEDCGLSSAEMVFGEPRVLPGQFLSSSPPAPGFLEQLRQSMERFSPPAVRPVPAAEPSKMESDLQQASFVYVRRGAPPAGLSPLYQGPYKVLLRGAKVFQLDIGGRTEVISVDRLKPHLGSSPVQPAEPPRRGRPPASGVGDRGRPPE